MNREAQEAVEAVGLLVGRRAALPAAVLLATSEPLDYFRLTRYVYLLQLGALQAGLLRPGEYYEFETLPTGPFSHDLASTLQLLKEYQVLEEEATEEAKHTPLGPVETTRYLYRVTEQGKEALKTILEQLGENRAAKLLALAAEIHEVWRDKSTRQLIEYIKEHVKGNPEPHGV